MRVVRVLLVALTLAALVVLAIGPARAQSSFTQEGAISEGQVVTVSCPDGQQFVSGEVRFFRSARAPRSFASAPLVAASSSQATAVAPKGARYYRADWLCEAVPEPTTTTAAP